MMCLTVGDGMYEYRYGYEHDYKINKAQKPITLEVVLV